MSENTTNDKIEAILSGLDDTEKRFVTYYCTVNMNKTEAAKFAGRAPASAKQAGYSMYYRTDVEAAIKKYLTLLLITPEENISRIAKTANTNVADYFTKVKIVQSIRTKSPLSKIIKDLELERDVEDEYLFESDNLTKLEKTLSLQAIKSLEKRIKKYQIELNRNPNATRFEYIETEVWDEIFDIKKAVRDKAPIKSIKYTDKGLQVEMCSPEAAQERMARIHGSFEKDNDQLRPVVNNNLSSERIKEIADKLDKDL